MALVPLDDVFSKLHVGASGGFKSRRSSKDKERENLEADFACVPLGTEGTNEIVLPLCVNDGRTCPRCSRKDTDQDLCNPLTTVPFGMGIRNPATGLWRGVPCFYCLRVFEARFKKEFKTFEKFQLKCGTDLDFQEEVNELVKVLVAKCIEVGGDVLAKFRVDWQTAHSIIKAELAKFKTIQIKQPDLYLMPVGDYLTDVRFGDTLTNGFNHLQITKDEKKYMLATDPDGTFIRKYARMCVSDGMTTTLSQSLGDSTLALDAGEIQRVADGAMQTHAPGLVGMTTIAAASAPPLADGQLLSTLCMPSAISADDGGSAVTVTPAGQRPKT